MKKVTLLLAVIALGTTACNKRNCWKCTTTETNSDDTGEFAGGTAKFTECNKTQAEIRLLEKERSGSEVIVGYSGATFTKTAITTCK